ncbi:serine-rich adhesin for platelets isoform X1 [Hyalella azteca]|uniref:Serine-rich adhesin for platelets isoform X1 n=1 Tax=Hyalella azteca TaxID=294128 RepID=A0A979FVS1_HYAAZ|nr:serine-rich adhesin for platelets isoform X1 [Hyalella azteca]
MDGGLLSLKWNNHRSTFFYVLSNVRKKECYTDVTLACDGKFYPVHKLVLSTCSEYFEQMFEQTQCKHPVIVLKDIRSEELESLLSYMYVGEVNVVQEKLSGLIKAAECLRIKGLAVPDEEPATTKSSGGSREKRTSDNSLSSEAKRRRQDDGSSSQRQTSSREETSRRRADQSSSNKFNRNNASSSSSSVNSSRENRDSVSDHRTTSRDASEPNELHHAQQDNDIELKAEELPDAHEDLPSEVPPEDPGDAVKQEPLDLDAVYLSDSNSASDTKDMLVEDSFGEADGQQHFMDELLGQNSASDQHGMGDYGEGGEGSSSSSAATNQQQQHMVVSSWEAHCKSQRLTATDDKWQTRAGVVRSEESSPLTTTRRGDTSPYLGYTTVESISESSTAISRSVPSTSLNRCVTSNLTETSSIAALGAIPFDDASAANEMTTNIPVSRGKDRQSTASSFPSSASKILRMIHQTREAKPISMFAPRDKNIHSRLHVGVFKSKDSTNPDFRESVNEESTQAIMEEDATLVAAQEMYSLQQLPQLITEPAHFCLESASSSSLDVSSFGEIPFSAPVPFSALDLESLSVKYREFVCPICMKCVRGDRQDFKRHYMIHSGERPEQCPYCSYRTIRKADLSKHVVSRHPELQLSCSIEQITDNRY